MFSLVMLLCLGVSKECYCKKHEGSKGCSSMIDMCKLIALELIYGEIINIHFHVMIMHMLSDRQ